MNTGLLFKARFGSPGRSLSSDHFSVQMGDRRGAVIWIIVRSFFCFEGVNLHMCSADWHTRKKPDLAFRRRIKHQIPPTLRAAQLFRAETMLAQRKQLVFKKNKNPPLHKEKSEVCFVYKFARHGFCRSAQVFPGMTPIIPINVRTLNRRWDVTVWTQAEESRINVTHLCSFIPKPLMSASCSDGA